MIKLGSRVREKYTGLMGTAIARTTSLDGSPQVCIEPDLDSDGNTRNDVWYNEGRIEVVPQTAPDNKAGFTAAPEK